MEKVTINAGKNPTPKAIVELAKQAVVEHKIYNFEVVDGDGQVMMEANGYKNSSEFATTEICNLWRELCESEDPWDEFDTLYPEYLEDSYDGESEDGGEWVEIKEDNE